MNRLLNCWGLCVKLLFRCNTQLSHFHQGNIKPKIWTIITSNHVTWVDILLLFALRPKSVVTLRFFLKQSLFRIPVVGLAMKAMHYPFMQRYSLSQMKKNPKLKLVNEETINQSCKILSQSPATLVLFLEGTRATSEKLAKNSGPYRYLLPPRNKGIGQVLSHWQSLQPQWLDYSIYYAHPTPSLWAFLCGEIKQIRVKSQVFPFQPEWVGDIKNDRQYQQKLQAILNDLWQEKDEWLAEQHQQA